MDSKKRTMGIAIIVILGLAALMYLSGLLGQLLANYSIWLESGGISGESSMPPVNWSLIKCLQQSFTPDGFKAMLIILAAGGGIFAYINLHDKFDGKEYDPRGFVKSKTGAYGTASWMTEKEMKDVLEIASPSKAEGIILGEHKGNVICLPKDTKLNRHIAIFGASGTMKSRAIIRNALFQAIKRNESVVITDPKGELFSDTAEMFRSEGYEVKVFNLVHPEHSDSWNCMSD